MESAVGALAEGVVAAVSKLDQSQRYLIGISGVPGSGKSTLARHVCDAVNAKLSSTQDGGAGGTENTAIIVGMDGWHYARSTLDKFPDPQNARDRRGAAFTFDASSFADFVSRLRTHPQELVRAPSFSHSEKDPIPDAITVEPSHRIIFLEGLYCNCNEGEWARGAKVLDERWVVEVSKDVARERLRIRHVETGVARDETEALWRADNNDLPNGDYLLAHTLEPTKRIPSLEEMSWV